jgi:hypothetical protein
LGDHDLTELELDLSNEVFVVVCVKIPDLEVKHFVFVEFITDVEMLNPLGVQVVINNFRFSNKLKRSVVDSSRLSFQRALRIRQRKHIQILKVLS